MDSKFNFLATGRTNEELLERIDNRQKYMPETVDASVAELQFRGHVFSDDELRVIDEDIQAHRNNAAQVDGRLGFFNNNTNNVIVNDPDAPTMYSRRALYTFTVLCGALFGSILMAMNISKTEKKGNAFWVVLFGIGFTVLQYYIMSNLAKQGSGSSSAIIGGIVAAYILDFIFWKRFIGYATFYRARQIWVPLVIAVVIGALLVLAIIYGGQQ
ncbi:hypothetical protein SAMN05216490_5047 [Mucilaginibacter mallensis]|uniref:Uncharacterized protein n=1 Tax=Mucilaginibacter mallensis TaxID=652787 RepID=A0A1H2CHX7_MUCMA|nr:hypothetical protein [Mucilaginibacter mallensis]SDT69656.1 hypothetical protein SAMN05216490_5047 [Mucilaginibacter mallensis]